MTLKQFLEEYTRGQEWAKTVLLVGSGSAVYDLAEAAYRAGFGEGYNEGLVADEVHNDLIYKPWD